MAIHQSALTPISDFFPLSKVATMWQTDGVAHKLKPRLFHKSAHLQVHSVDFHPGMNCTWYLNSIAFLTIVYIWNYFPYIFSICSEWVFLSFSSQLDIFIHEGRFIGFSLRFSFMKEQIQMFEVEEQMKNFVYSCILAFFSSSSC